MHEETKVDVDAATGRPYGNDEDSNAMRIENQQFQFATFFAKE